jgi:hypothetical protein
MKSLLIGMALLCCSSVFALSCSGEGYNVDVNDSVITITGNGLNISTNAQDYGSSFVAQVNDQGVRSVTLFPYSNNMTMVLSNGAKTVAVTCN